MKKRLAFVDLTNFSTWPMGGMLEYERSLLPYFAAYYDIDLWGVNVDDDGPARVNIDGKEYDVMIFAHCKTTHKVIPNFWKGLALFRFKENFYDTYDVVYVHTATCATALSCIINPKKTKLIYHHHCFSYLKDKRLFALVQKPFYRIALKRANASFIVADERSVNTYCKECGFNHDGRFIPIGSPVELTAFDRSNIINRIETRSNRNDFFKFVYAGRIDSWKNVDLLVKAFGLYYQSNRHSHLTIIGSGPNEKDVMTLVERMSIKNCVSFVGNISHNKVCKQLEDSDIFLISSKGEGWSVAVLEAFAAGLPVVCGKVQGLKDEVKEGVTGFFSKEYNEFEFYHAMEKACRNIKELSINALNESEKYHASIISKHIIEEIESLC